ncbi:hypothetical protein [Sphingopyxis sp.]|uniref:hypothetical protein n=1 Tax=Sphingopyxis sp. TaxID=1908224 RepID=UPI00311EBBB5
MSVTGDAGKDARLVRQKSPDMKVTFDSNLYRRVTEPARFGRDPAYAAYSAIHEAIRAGTIQPFFSATIVTLEAVGREQRGAYMSSQRIKADTNASPAGEHRIRGRLTIGADDSVHPGLPPILERWLEEALALGFRFLAAPRLGQPRPRILHDAPNFAPVEELDLNKFGEIVGEMEARGLGSAPARAIAASIRLRNPRIPMHPWSRALAFAADRRHRFPDRQRGRGWRRGGAVLGLSTCGLVRAHAISGRVSISWKFPNNPHRCCAAGS